MHFQDELPQNNDSIRQLFKYSLFTHKFVAIKLKEHLQNVNFNGTNFQLEGSIIIYRTLKYYMKHRVTSA